MEKEKNRLFWGTLFNREVVLQITRIAKLFAWIIAGFYVIQWILQLAIFITQAGRGFWVGAAFTDIMQNLFWQFEQPLRALVYFVVLQSIAQVLLMILEIENNTRASGITHKQ